MENLGLRVQTGRSYEVAKRVKEIRERVAGAQGGAQKVLRLSDGDGWSRIN